MFSVNGSSSGASTTRRGGRAFGHQQQQQCVVLMHLFGNGFGHGLDQHPLRWGGQVPGHDAQHGGGIGLVTAQFGANHARQFQFQQGS